MADELAGSRASRVIALAASKGLTIATAESLTGGLVCDALVAVEGASAVVRGGVVAYDAEVKHTVLGVSELLLEAEGPVSHAVASAMARGARRHLGADVAVATTGVAGPDAHGGQPPGVVVIAVVTADADSATTFTISGDREGVRRGATEAALAELERMLSPDATE